MADAPITVTADTRGIARLGRDLRSGAGDVWRECKKALLESTEAVQASAVARVEGWSKADPPSANRRGAGVAASIRVQVTALGNAKVVAGGAQAPEAAPIENRGAGFVRHPTFGHRERMTSKNSHPAFLAPAFDHFAQESVAHVVDTVMDAVEKAVRGG